MTEKNTIEDFLEKLSSKAPVPGGGGTSALAGALGSALGLMVSNLTIGKKKYADVEERIIRLKSELEEILNDFLKLSDDDEKVFAPLAKAYSLPAETEEEKEYKKNIMEKRLLEASLVPLEIMRKSMTALSIISELESKGSVMAVSDVGVAVEFLRTAITGAVMNVYINTKSMNDTKMADKLNQEADMILKNGIAEADRIYEAVRTKLRKG